MNLHNKYKTAKQSKEKLLLEREKEIEKTTKKIIKSYSQKLTQNDKDITFAKKELNAFDKLFAKYSTFDINLVGKAIQQLISIVENEEYIYKQVTHKFKIVQFGFIDSWTEDVQIKVKIIVRKDKLINCYESSDSGESKIDELVKNGDALLLTEKDKDNNDEKCIFYTSQDGQVICNVDFGKFDYIKKFIDSIIQYRFQNDLTKFTEKDMLSFMKNFLIEHRDIILKNYSSKIKEKALSLI